MIITLKDSLKVLRRLGYLDENTKISKKLAQRLLNQLYFDKFLYKKFKATKNKNLVVSDKLLSKITNSIKAGSDLKVKGLKMKKKKNVEEVSEVETKKKKKKSNDVEDTVKEAVEETSKKNKNEGQEDGPKVSKKEKKKLKKEIKETTLPKKRKSSDSSITSVILNCMQDYTTKDDILKEVIKRFPEKNEKTLMNTISWNISTGFPRKGMKIEKKDNKYKICF